MTSHAYQYRKLQAMTTKLIYMALYANDPLANEEWTLKYQKKVDAKNSNELAQTEINRYGEMHSQ